MESAFPITVSLLLAFVTFLYARGWLLFRTTLPYLVSFAKVAAFLTGILLVWLAVASPLASLDHQLLTVHMIQHLLLMAVAAPLLLMGAPFTILLHVVQKGLVPNFSCRSLNFVQIDWIQRILSQPVLCWFAGTITVLAWHIPALLTLTLHSHWLHGIEQVSFVAAGLLFWRPVVEPWPSVPQGARWSVPLYLFLATLPCDALSAYLVFCDHVIYPTYFSSSRLLDITVLQDQQWAGAFMWVAVTFIYTVPAIMVILQLLSKPSRVTQVFDHGKPFT